MRTKGTSRNFLSHGQDVVDMGGVGMPLTGSWITEAVDMRGDESSRVKG